MKLDHIIAALKEVEHPILHKDLMALGMIRDVKILEGTGVQLKLVLSGPSIQIKDKLERDVREALTVRAGATRVEVSVETAEPKKSSSSIDMHGVPGVKQLIAVSSGKGGVGKSTVASNLAMALSTLGFEVGLLDTDVYGPNIPTMMGKHEPPHARNDEVRGELLLPIEAHGLKLMSMGFLTKGDQPLVWRGPMLHSVVSQFLFKVDWGNLDFLIIDMPPGTGDVQLSLTQLAPVSGVVMVTTPQEVAVEDVRKAILMFEKVNVPVFGIVENMSYFECGSCNTKHEIFGSGGGKHLAEKYHTKLLAQIPVGTNVREAGDAGEPVVVRDPESFQAKAFIKLARDVAAQAAERTAEQGTTTGAPGLEISGF